VELHNEPLYDPYTFRFQIGDILYLKNDDDLIKSYAALQAEIPHTRSWLTIDWMPPLEALMSLQGISLNAVGITSFHCGYPLYELTFEYKGESYQIRLCEAVLKK
jgi:hypothetical protein